MARRTSGPGRIRLKLAKMIQSKLPHGWTMRADDLYVNNLVGMARIHEDTATWDGYARSAETGARIKHMYSYDTMTDCVKYGFDIYPELDWEILANRKQPKT